MLRKCCLKGTAGWCYNPQRGIESTRNSKNHYWRKVAFLYYDHKTKAEHLVCSAFVLIQIRGNAESLQDATITSQLYSASASCHRSEAKEVQRPLARTNFPIGADKIEDLKGSGSE